MLALYGCRSGRSARALTIGASYRAPGAEYDRGLTSLSSPYGLLALSGWIRLHGTARSSLLALSCVWIQIRNAFGIPCGPCTGCRRLIGCWRFLALSWRYSRQAWGGPGARGARIGILALSCIWRRLRGLALSCYYVSPCLIFLLALSCVSWCMRVLCLLALSRLCASGEGLWLLALSCIHSMRSSLCLLALSCWVVSPFGRCSPVI
jgi:hypothetical protein